MRLESQWFRGVTFGVQLWKDFFLEQISSHFHSYTLFLTQRHRRTIPKPRTHTLSDNLKRDTYRLWTLGGHGRVREEQRQREWRARPHCVTLTSQPSSQTRGRDRRGSLTWKRGWEDGGLAGVCQEETAASSQSGRGETAVEGKPDRQKQNSKTPAVSSSPSSSLSLV